MTEEQFKAIIKARMSSGQMSRDQALGAFAKWKQAQSGGNARAEQEAGKFAAGQAVQDFGAQRDADIYIEISKLFPNRVKAIYLRSVSNSRRMARVSNLFKGYKSIPFLMVNKTEEAIAHAKKNGFI